MTVKRIRAMMKRVRNSVARSFRGWRKAKRNKREMKIFMAGAGKPVRVESEDPRELERNRIMRGNGPGQGWRNY